MFQRAPGAKSALNSPRETDRTRGSRQDPHSRERVRQGAGSSHVLGNGRVLRSVGSSGINSSLAHFFVVFKEQPTPSAHHTTAQITGVVSRQILSYGAGCGGSFLSVKGRQVHPVGIQDPGRLVCCDLCNIFVHILQPPTPETTQWRISSAWAWLARSWWSLECCCFRLKTAREWPRLLPGPEHREDRAWFREGEPWSRVPGLPQLTSPRIL